MFFVTHTIYLLYVRNSYIPQMELHESKGQNAVPLRNETYLLDVTPSNPLPHLLSPLPFPFCDIQVQRFGC